MTNLNFVCNSLDVDVDNCDQAAVDSSTPEIQEKLLKTSHVQCIPKLEKNHDHDEEDIKTTVEYKADILTFFTFYTVYCLNVCYGFLKNFKSTPAYRVLFTTTQPAHIIMVIAITLVSALFFPYDQTVSSTAKTVTTLTAIRKPITSRSTYLIYLTALSLHVGSQFWMTFVSGLSLYFNLARHAFGDVQRILFPRYFTLNCVLSAVILIQFGRLHGRQISEYDLHTVLQVIALSLCFLLELLIRLYLVPSVLQLISIKTAIEKTAGVGQEVGRYELGPLLKCPHYMAIHKSFRKVHMGTAIGNIISMMCSAFHLYYLANKWTDHLAV